MFINFDTQLHVEHGHFREHTITTRYDAEQAADHVLSASTDGEALFFTFARREVLDMLGHDRLIVRFTPFNAPPQVVEFDLRGIERAVQPVRKACNW